MPNSNQTIGMTSLEKAQRMFNLSQLPEALIQEAVKTKVNNHKFFDGEDILAFYARTYVEYKNEVENARNFVSQNNVTQRRINNDAQRQQSIEELQAKISNGTATETEIEAAKTLKELGLSDIDIPNMFR